MKLNEINIRDPFILNYNNTYYLYGTKMSGSVPGFDVYKSTDLVNWSEPKVVFEAGGSFWGEYNFWAPEVHFFNGKFYMLATFKAENKSRATHILVCSTPDGTFVPVSDKPATPDTWECLDGTLYIDKNGEPHMVFCHEWMQISNGTVCEIKLSKDLTKPISEPRVLWSASDFENVKSVTEKPNDFVTDGPFLFRNSKNELLCIWSSFSENGYCELISRSDNGEIDGNWSILSTPLSSSDGGHGMIFKDFSGNLKFVMHKPNCAPLERPVILSLKDTNGTLTINE